MSCEYCEHHKKQPDFDGETYMEIRLGKTLGYPAIVGSYDGAWCASYGINFCPWCGEDLREMSGDKDMTELAVTFTCPKDEKKRDGRKCLKCYFCIHGIGDVFYCAWNIREEL